MGSAHFAGVRLWRFVGHPKHGAITSVAGGQPGARSSPTSLRVWSERGDGPIGLNSLAPLRGAACISAAWSGGVPSAPPPATVWQPSGLRDATCAAGGLAKGKRMSGQRSGVRYGRSNPEGCRRPRHDAIVGIVRGRQPREWRLEISCWTHRVTPWASVHTSPRQRPGTKQGFFCAGQRPFSYHSNSMNVTCEIDQGWGSQVDRGGGPMNRAVGAQG